MAPIAALVAASASRGALDAMSSLTSFQTPGASEREPGCSIIVGLIQLSRLYMDLPTIPSAVIVILDSLHTSVYECSSKSAIDASKYLISGISDSIFLLFTVIVCVTFTEHSNVRISLSAT